MMPESVLVTKFLYETLMNVFHFLKMSLITQISLGTRGHKT